MKNKIIRHIRDHSNLIRDNIDDISFCIEEVTKDIKKTLKNKKTIFFVGNGGSAADCEHIAGELVGRYKKIDNRTKQFRLLLILQLLPV